MSSESHKIESFRARVKGRVQGVGFRWSTRRAAQKIGICGWVRNCEDGSVEVHAEGDSSQLAEFRDFLMSGPLAARVDQLELSEDNVARMPDFTIVDQAPYDDAEN